MRKVYKNIFGEIISKSNAVKLSEYHLYYYEEGSDFLKEIEFINEDSVYNINYFLSDEEDETQVVNYLKEKSDFFDIEKKETTEGFIISTNKLYSLSVDELPLISKTVFKTEDPENFICSQVIDNETHQPQLERTIKCWYTNDESGEKYAAIECSYQEDGKLELAVDKTPDPDNEENWIHYDYDTFHNLQAQIPSDISYYKTAALLPKETYQQ
ncbi:MULTISPECIES: hypothetical protein [Chryseobacterium]|uniref:DUF4178 domain-containing protein n=1 Tax=Chryseobacterium cucumeris TaxID=1813611 RepID=A0ABX9X9Z5_9FLAO|nr:MULTISPECIES: hypothetical protein [Chryseobacterium]KYH08010.1 hypothetical protein A1704_04920 [Chryseobacterium cucumeris]MDH5034219.1 hypothetical protein [Chryseobacterium cucumeris]RKE80548.1 hypothetical protein DEU39_0060 [Chryseobacterium sp. AG363]ROH95109.1 hypothetical protein EGI15_04400 [Chryseobacterium cucumeris]TXJ00612.1 MAG: hypothetical protein E6Q35_00500 [Chryseobacterium cucumeris]